jgi:hypothetical protein
MITLDEPLDDSSIDALKALEREMWLAGDVRSEVLREVLDLLSMHEIILDTYNPPKLKLAHNEIMVHDRNIGQVVAKKLRKQANRVGA